MSTVDEPKDSEKLKRLSDMGRVGSNSFAFRQFRQWMVDYDKSLGESQDKCKSVANWVAGNLHGPQSWDVLVFYYLKVCAKSRLDQSWPNVTPDAFSTAVANLYKLAHPAQAVAFREFWLLPHTSTWESLVGHLRHSEDNLRMYGLIVDRLRQAWKSQGDPGPNTPIIDAWRKAIENCPSGVAPIVSDEARRAAARDPVLGELVRWVDAVRGKVDSSTVRIPRATLRPGWPRRAMIALSGDPRVHSGRAWLRISLFVLPLVGALAVTLVIFTHRREAKWFRQHLLDRTYELPSATDGLQAQ